MVQMTHYRNEAKGMPDKFGQSSPARWQARQRQPSV